MTVTVTTENGSKTFHGTQGAINQLITLYSEWINAVPSHMVDRVTVKVYK